MTGLSSPPWSSRTKRLIVLITLGLVLLGILQLGNAWVPVIIAILVAYLLMPIADAWDRGLGFIPITEIRRTLAVLLTFATVIIALGLFGWLIVPPLSDQLVAFGENLPVLVEDIQGELQTPINLGFSEFEPWSALQDTLSSNENEQGPAGDVLALLFAPAVNIVGGVFSVLVGIFLTVAMLFMR